MVDLQVGQEARQLEAELVEGDRPELGLLGDQRGLVEPGEVEAQHAAGVPLELGVAVTFERDRERESGEVPQRRGGVGERVGEQRRGDRDVETGGEHLLVEPVVVAFVVIVGDRVGQVEHSTDGPPGRAGRFGGTFRRRGDGGREALGWGEPTVVDRGAADGGEQPVRERGDGGHAIGAGLELLRLADGETGEGVGVGGQAVVDVAGVENVDVGVLVGRIVAPAADRAGDFGEPDDAATEHHLTAVGGGDELVVG